MSQIEADALTEEVIAEYLRDNPDFFLSRRELVDRLALPHQEQGTVSLVHVQLNRQRQRIEELEEDITSLMSLAKSNDQTFHEFMALQEQILKCDSLLSVVKAIEEMAKSLGLVAYVRLLESESSYYSLAKESYLRFATNHLNGKEAYLGRMRKADRELLFGDNHRAPEMGSYVVLPLKRKSLQGVLAFSSTDGGHFQPHMDTLFLRHLALVLSHLIESLPWQCEQDERISNTSS
ncbi:MULTISPECIES: DUF484 family protein [Vibrio]|uniref:3',5'-cyclic-nucleotide phosphodiesterase n=2 Tax=Vibrio TaxID=662 RepID=A0A0A5HZV9_PHOS4|nr:MULTISPECIES: DUF484 family protein [Vibrio]EED25282.1 conserved hypothetical protein [Vibrio sp. 16]KGY09024.1 3',5'-cyclic-nucleotide phosphodiesterase [Vibrio sinaloensis]KHD23653.1 3',5'-cyclic-nucleotide phosphodiesterase [Vibrio caribbeanicus]KHT47095.1 3',5'-cyclic-nucleotide phosphodiesterase [Vibrio sinaloensis]KHT51293.1 3',5'-cyclic-nucleotide phosphodiesterase [Vibrio sinaloensis]